MTVKPVAKSDCGKLAALHARCFPSGWPAAEIARLISETGVIALKAGDDEPTGFILVRRVADEAEILTLAVDPEHRRHGHARALLTSASEILIASGTLKFFLEVSGGNTAAISLYSLAGFSQAGRRRAYYSDGSDALVMEKTLAQ
ncbi:GNAT family N-acetyltransferase [Hyphobacterium sp. HN65]|uniref:GNAT family N-acetyltransferase n=1 Tax=Hyphobacterium lacteum TaxID=3116575 RepID=A0ABU7LS16_9PROT|nr:GNAT family N-acetyltransferase [Hyphobacterium sp. HN65]MEE2526687.1 GNAT family N-acetyltransferase [Hyphobacterium sp. HN65]